MEGFLWQPSSQKFPSDQSEMDTKYAGAGWVQTIKKFLSQNHIENFPSFLTVSRLMKLKSDDFRPFLVFWSKSPLFRL